MIIKLAQPYLVIDDSTTATKVNPQQLSIPEMVCGTGNRKRKLSTKTIGNTKEKKAKTAVRDTAAVQLKKPTEVIYI